MLLVGILGGSFVLCSMLFGFFVFLGVFFACLY